MEKLLTSIKEKRDQVNKKDIQEETIATISRCMKTSQFITYTQTKTIALTNEQYRKKRIIEGSDDLRVVDAYKILRTQVLRKMKQNNWKSIGVTSARENEGKSLTAINLAVSISKEVNHTVLLVDLDLRNPGIHQYFYYEPKIGIADYLQYDVEVSDIMVNPEIPRLVVIPGRGKVKDSSELLSSPKMSELSAEFRSRYPERIVIYDLPPLLASDDTMAFLPSIDSVLLVIEEGATQKNEIQKAVGLLQDTPLLGSVLNKTKEKINTY